MQLMCKKINHTSVTGENMLIIISIGPEKTGRHYASNGLMLTCFGKSMQDIEILTW